MPKSIVALCVALLLSACGQTGALYLPDRGKPPARHKDKPAKIVPASPSPAAPGAKADAATPAPNPDEATPAASPPSP